MASATGGLTSGLVRALDFFVYSRDAPGTEALREDDDLLEEHWSYMDRFAASMIARGPTFSTDRATVTGSLHVIGLPSVDAMHEFVAHEPNNRAGVYAEHSVSRFENLLGHTMWEYPGAADETKFLIIAHSHGSPKAAARGGPVPPGSLSTELRKQLIVYGALRTLDDAAPVGVALAVQAEDRQTVDTLLEQGRAGLTAFPSIEIHDWEFGGRR
jgi:uncharacterized protein